MKNQNFLVSFSKQFSSFSPRRRFELSTVQADWETCLVHNTKISRSIGQGICPHERDAFGWTKAHAKVGELGLAFSLRQSIQINEDSAGPELAIVMDFEILAWLIADNRETFNVIRRIASYEGYPAHQDIYCFIVGIKNTRT